MGGGAAERAERAPLDEHFFVWRQTLRSKLIDVFDIVDNANKSLPTIIARQTISAPPGLIREAILFESFDGTPITAIQQRPDITGTMAAVMLIPGHTRDSESGLSQLVDEPDSYQGAAATVLAKAGFATIAFELRGFGVLGSALNIGHKQVAYNAMLNGTFYKALVVKDALFALRILASDPQVDETRIGVAGASLGGELAVAVSALSDSVKALAFSSYGGGLGPFREVQGRQTKQPHYCHIVPGSGKFMNQEDWLLLSVPRPVAGFRGDQEKHRSAIFSDAMLPYWESFGSPEHFQFTNIDNGGHVFFVERTLAFFRNNL